MAGRQTSTVEPGGYLPAMMSRATGVSIRRWMVRLRGRAPKSGS